MDVHLSLTHKFTTQGDGHIKKETNDSDNIGKNCG